MDPDKALRRHKLNILETSLKNNINQLVDVFKEFCFPVFDGFPLNGYFERINLKKERRFIILLNIFIYYLKNFN